MSNFVTDSSRGEVGPRTAWVADWQQTPTLMALRRLLDTSRRATPALARRAGLSHSEMAVLEHVFGDPLGPTELAQRLGVTSAAISGIVDRLVERGHVVREAHATDKRRTVVAATPTGREELLAYLMPMFIELAAADAALTEPERAAVLRYLVAAERAVSRLQ